MAGDTSAQVDQAYMTGMMSLLEAVLEIPMRRIVDELRFGDDIRAALLDRQGRLGDYLSLVECVECLDTACLTGKLDALSLSLDQLTTAEIDAMRWANSIGQEVG
jgi:EAL and modified HD-GYP domain-containing signal transduction protein